MSGPYMSNSTSLRHTPESITVWILSLGPSDRYESAQQASARTSGSLLKSNMESTLRHGDTCEETTVVWSCYKGIKRFTQRECVCVHHLNVITMQLECGLPRTGLQTHLCKVRRWIFPSAQVG